MKELKVQNGQNLQEGTLLFRLEATPESLQVAEIEARLQAQLARISDARKGERNEQLEMLDAQIAEAQASLGFALAELDRSEQLLASGSITVAAVDMAKSSRDQAEASLKALQARRRFAELGQRDDYLNSLEYDAQALKQQLELARWNLEQCSQHATSQVLVENTLYAVGEWVAPGAPVVVLRPADRMLVVFFVNTLEMAELKRSQSVQVHLPGIRDPLSARITFVATQAEYTPPVIYSREQSATLVFRVEAELEGAWAGELQPGLPVQVEL